MNLKVSVDFSDGGAGAQAAHDCDQVSGGDLALALLVVQREALLELCEWENKTNGESFPVRSQQMCPFHKAASSVISETAEMIKFRPDLNSVSDSFCLFHLTSKKREPIVFHVND